MDTTETYIKMCEKSEEIQAFKKTLIHWDDGGLPPPIAHCIEAGNVFYMKETVTLEEVYTPVKVKAIYNTFNTHIPQGVYIVGDVCRSGASIEKYSYAKPKLFDILVPPFALERFIWLPRQDQLQELVIHRGHPHHLDNLITSFDNWYFYGRGMLGQDKEEDFPSMEQLWLAFVMKEKYNKTWDGERWLK